jgi:hypothetical protein
MVIPRSGANVETAFCISTLSVKMTAKWSFVIKIMHADTIPMMRDSITMTTTEYFAALGCPDPSALETLTLIKEKQKKISFIQVVKYSYMK